MKAVQITKPYSVQVVEKDAPRSDGKSAIIKVKAAGICGSDMGAFRGTNKLVSYPRIIGHEIAGEIVSVPSDRKLNPKGFKVGDRVVVDPYLYCGHCYPCTIGRTNCCVNLKVLGVHVDGGMCAYLAHPANMLVPIPSGLGSWELASMAEPLCISLHGLHRGHLAQKEFFLVFGAGTIGILAALAAKYYGAEPIVVDVVEERLALVRDLGVAHTVNSKKENLREKVAEITHGEFVHVVMEASGANDAIRSTFEVVRNAGRIVLTGWPKDQTLLPTDVITKKELDVRGARTSVGEFAEALALIAEKKIPVASVLTKVVSVNSAASVICDMAENPGKYLKVVVKF